MFEFKKPTLSAFDATPEEARIAARYTRIREIVMDGSPEAHTAWLIVGNQQFCVAPMGHCGGAPDTAEEASWFCWMLAKAIIQIQAEAVAVSSLPSPSH